MIAGEASGDMYGARLGREMIQRGAARNESIVISGMGGPAMQKAGFDIRVDSTELGVVGIFEVLKHIFTFISIFFKLVREAWRERPEAVILIDYPGFNLVFALCMYMKKIPVIWYICPHLWVWAKWRLPVLSRICSRMLVIFPFEVEVFEPTPLNAEFVGHPLLDLMAERHDSSLARDPDTFLLLPGSRGMEVSKLLKPMLDTVTELHKKHPQLKFVLSAPREKIAKLSTEIYQKYRTKHPECPEVLIDTGDTGRWQQIAGTGLAASGTVTVECAIAGLPLVVGYKLNFLTLLVGIVLVRLYRGFFTMVNIIANRAVFAEFLQWRFCVKELLPAVEAILPGGTRRQEVEAGMAEVAQLLSPGSESAIGKAAEACLDGNMTEDKNKQIK